MIRFMRILLFLPLLMIVHPVPSYCEDDKHLSSVMLLLNSKPLMADIIAKATTQFGSEVNAAVAILLSANQGYSWSQILDAIEAGTLKDDGSITGISPQRGLSHQKTLSITRPIFSTNFTPEEIRAACEDFFDGELLIELINKAICQNYSKDQIIEALRDDSWDQGNFKVWSNGFIWCNQVQMERGLCTLVDHTFILIPDSKGRAKYYKDCSPEITTQLIIPKGCWKGYQYYVKIEDAEGGYKYTGSNNLAFECVGGVFKHSGTISYKSLGKYEGMLEDLPLPCCCGNWGEIWIEQTYEDKMHISAIWYAPPDDIIIKEAEDDLKRITCP